MTEGAAARDTRRWPVRRAESFGGVAIRTTDGVHEVALIRTRSLKGKDIWGLPKGGADTDEPPEQTALREVREETGLEAEIVEHLEDVTYFFAWPPEQVRYRKVVHLYLMRVTGGDIADHDHEVEEVRFVPIGDAARAVTYPTDRKVIKRAAELVAAW